MLVEKQAELNTNICKAHKVKPQAAVSNQWLSFCREEELSVCKLPWLDSNKKKKFFIYN